MSYRPTTELVIKHYLKTLDGLPTDSIATNLPRRSSDSNFTWAASGFILIGDVSGGPQVYVPIREPVIPVQCMAVNPDKATPPWGKANQLAEEIVTATYTDDLPALIQLPTGYNNARLHSLVCVREPFRVPGDHGAFAIYGLDLQAYWTPVE